MRVDTRCVEWRLSLLPMDGHLSMNRDISRRSKLSKNWQQIRTTGIEKAITQSPELDPSPETTDPASTLTDESILFVISCITS